MIASHAGIVSNVRTSSSIYLQLRSPRASLSVKLLKSFRFPAPLFKPGAHGMTPSISVLDVAEFVQSGPGLAFLHRLVMAFHLVCVEVGACGIRLACLFLKLSGLDRFVAASYGAQQHVNRQVEAAMVAYRQNETARLAKGMPRKDLTVTPDETFTGGLCLVTMDPESNFIILEQLAQTRNQAKLECAHGTGPGTAQLSGDSIHQ